MTLAFAALLTLSIVNVTSSQEASIPKYWAGEFTGLPSGTFSFEVTKNEDLNGKISVDGILRLQAQGPEGMYRYKYSIEGEFKIGEGAQEVFVASGTFLEGPDGRPFGDLQAELTYSTDRVLVGEWRSELGTSGIATAYPVILY